MISIIVAVNKNLAIGFENKLLYWLPNDLKRFKALTTGHTIIMGRKTFDSLPKGALPIADRLCITEIDDDKAQADTFFPAIDLNVWQEKSRECHSTDEKHLYSYSFVDYVRK